MTSPVPANRKKGSLLGAIMRSRDSEEQGTKVVIPPSPVPAPATPALMVRPAAPLETEALGGPKGLVPPAAPKSATPAVQVPPPAPAGKGSGETPLTPAPELRSRRTKIKKSYAIKISNVDDLELLAWFWDVSDSSVVDQALDLLLQAKAQELAEARALNAAKGERREAV